jgi:hypothetical protein
MYNTNLGGEVLKNSFAVNKLLRHNARGSQPGSTQLLPLRSAGRV